MKLAILTFILCLCSLTFQARAGQSPATSSVNDAAKDAKATAAKNSVTVPPEKAQPVRVSRLDTPPVIDGKLDDAVWKSATVLKNFYQVQPGDNIAPSRPTEVLIGYDSKFFYIAFRATDEPGKVRANVPKRDGIWDDDYVGMYLDTFNDRRKAYTFFFNPLGVQADGVVSDTNEDYSLDIVMESKGVVTEDGFTVEIAIPFKSLRYEAGEGKLWGAHFFRRIKRFNNELTSWMPLSRENSSWIAQAGRITGLEGIAVERTLEVIPTLTLSETGRRVQPVSVSVADPGRFVNQPVKVDPGVNIKLGLTPTIILDFTANPDFAQVEADQPVITANQRFPIFFQEKRPFFLEGQDIFQTPIQAVHTRAIVDPDYAVKLTGKRGRNTFGLLLASDNAPGNFSEEERNDPDVFPDIEKFLDKNAYIGVLRLKRDVGDQSSLGLIATSYNFIERHNQLGGIDGSLRIDKKTVFSFQALATTSRRLFPDLDNGGEKYRTGNGFAYDVTLDYSGRNFGYFLHGDGRTRDYRADVGFTRRTNTNYNTAFFRFSTDPNPDPKAKFVALRVFTALETNYDFQARLQGLNYHGRAILTFARNIYWGAGTNQSRERLYEEEFGLRRSAGKAGAFFGDPERSAYRKVAFTFFEAQPSKKYSGFVEVVYVWNAFDFDFGAGPRYPRVSPAALADPDAALDPGTGKELGIYSAFNYQPTAALRASLNYTKSRLRRNDTGLVAYDDDIYSLRVTYQFTRFTSVRARLDYDSLSASVRGQYLFGWTPNPGTSFYVGYNDDMNYNGFNPHTGLREPGFHRNSRTFFIKTSYLFRRSL